MQILGDDQLSHLFHVAVAVIPYAVDWALMVVIEHRLDVWLVVYRLLVTIELLSVCCSKYKSSSIVKGVSRQFPSGHYYNSDDKPRHINRNLWIR